MTEPRHPLLNRRSALGATAAAAASSPPAFRCEGRAPREAR